MARYAAWFERLELATQRREHATKNLNNFAKSAPSSAVTDLVEAIIYFSEYPMSTPSASAMSTSKSTTKVLNPRCWRGVGGGSVTRVGSGALRRLKSESPRSSPIFCVRPLITLSFCSSCSRNSRNERSNAESAAAGDGAAG